MTFPTAAVINNIIRHLPSVDVTLTVWQAELTFIHDC